MNSRKPLVYIIIAIFIFTGSSVFSAEGPAAKVGIINIQRVLSESKAGKAAKSDFDKETLRKQMILQYKENDIRQLEDELKTKGQTFTPEARKDKEDSLAQEVKKFQRLKQDFEEELKKKDVELASKVFQEIIDLTKKVGEENHYAIIYQAGPQIVYNDKSADITDEVLKRYDSQYSVKK